MTVRTMIASLVLALAAMTAFANAGDELEGTAWRLLNITSMDDTVSIPEESGNYTLRFDAEGRFAIKSDCMYWLLMGSDCSFDLEIFVRLVIYCVLFLILMVFSVLFFAQNSQEVILSFFIGQQPVPLAYVIVASIVFGFLLGLLSLMLPLIKRKVQLKSVERQLNQKKQEIENLRTMPVRDDF